MNWYLFLDESGDLGFDFKNKNPSKYLTLTVLAVSQLSSVDVIRRAVTKTLRRKVNKGKKGRKRPAQELKGTNTSLTVKQYFYRLIEQEKFGVYAITLNKRRIYAQLCNTPHAKDRLYNFVAQQAISKIPFEAAGRDVSAVDLIVDRSKGKAGIKDFDNYVLSQLQGRLAPHVALRIRHRQSHVDLGLSAVDLFSWGIFRRHERDDTEWYNVFQKKVLLDERYLK